MGRYGISTMILGVIFGLFAASVLSCVNAGSGGGGGGGTIPTKSTDYIAIVGDTKVDLSDLDGEYQFRGYLKEYIYQVMLRDKAVKVGLKITDEDVEEHMKDLITSYGGEEEFGRFLKSMQIARDEFIKSQRAFLISTMLLNQRIPISDEDVRDFYDSNAPWVKQAHASQFGFTQAEVEMLTFDDVKETAKDMIFQDRAALEYSNFRKDIILEYKDRIKLNPALREIEWGFWITGEDTQPVAPSESEDGEVPEESGADSDEDAAVSDVSDGDEAEGRDSEAAEGDDEAESDTE